MKMIIIPFVIAFAVLGCKQDKIRPSSQTEINAAAAKCFFDAKELIYADLKMERAERTLAAQMTPGEASLKTIEFQESKERVKDKWREYKEKRETLKSVEAGAENMTVFGISIDDFLDVNRHYVAVHGSIIGFQKDDQCYDQYVKLLDIKLEDLEP